MSLVGGAVRAMWVSTFHSACVRILRRDAARFGYRSTFSIYDSADSLRLIGQVMKDLDLDPKRFPPRSISTAISKAKNELVDYETFASQDTGYYHEQVADVYRLYSQRLIEASAMDFDDLLKVTVELLSSFPRGLGAMARALSLRHGGRVPGYEPRAVQVDPIAHGAIIETSVWWATAIKACTAFEGLTFGTSSASKRTIPMRVSLSWIRTTGQRKRCWDAANSVIANNTQRKPKRLWTDRGKGEPIVYYQAEDEHDEAAFVAEQVGLLEKAAVAAQDVAVFYRTNAQARVVEDVLTRYGLAYKVVGGLKFYERKEIKDAIGYLRVLVNLMTRLRSSGSSMHQSDR